MQFAKRLIRSGLSRVVPWMDLHRDIDLHLGHNQKWLTLFDVGANVGQTIDAFRYRWPHAHILAFEPSPKTFEVLNRTHARKAELFQLAMGERCGTMPFHVTAKHSVNDSLLPMPGEESTTVDVEATTLDDFCYRRGTHRIDYLKIDTQGYDLNVLKGAARMLAERKIIAFSVELIFQPTYDGQAAYPALLAHADSTGYRLHGFYAPTYLSGKLTSCDALYVH